jgi:hypothetical protein
MAAGKKIDDSFLSILRDWAEMTSVAAAGAVEMILRNSGEYLSSEQQKAVSDFHDLYFSDADVAASKEAMNREVDDLFDAVQAEMAGGASANMSAVRESDDAKRTRLSLSGVQKQLETIIQLENGLKEKLVPVLTSMQFEDAIKQRLQHMADGWRLVLSSPPKTDADVTVMAEAIAKTLSSATERQAFYPNVLKRPAPKDVVDDLTLFESLV